MERLRMLWSVMLGAVMTSDVLLIGLGGGLGSAARYLVGRWIHERNGGGVFPVGTMVVNILGCFFLGVLVGFFLEQGLRHVGGWFNFFGTGFCGGFTTFSALQWETAQLIKNGHLFLALSYVAISISVGLFGVVLGYLLGRWIAQWS